MKITPIAVKGTDERGFVAEYLHDRAGKQLLVFTHAGKQRGRHYHKGLSATKNPEVFFLYTGKCRLNWRNIQLGGVEESVVIEAPARVEIEPWEWHELIAETDCIFVELNSIEEHAADTFYDA